MSAVRSMFYFSDGTTFSSAKQYGPFNISGLGKLSRVRVRGVVTFPLATFGSATQLYNSTVWGIQHVPHGSAANDAISGGDSDAWLDLAEHVPDEINATWAPTSANAFSVTGGPLRLDWAGQLAINANTDFWFSMTSQEPTFTSVAITASLEVLWT